VQALLEGEAAAEINGQIEESKVHAAQFRVAAEKARKRFVVLAKVAERAADHCQAQLTKVTA
jgi:hypothetical protein